uniref:MFS domain-containing protein n=1 Tax=Globodera pallida TaxID=36090 RepID=A0A183BN68_GLOPA
MSNNRQKIIQSAAEGSGGREGEEQKDDQRRVIGWCPKALDGGYGWVVVFGSFMIHVFADGFVYSFGVIAESLIGEFQSTNTEASTILSLLTGLMLAAGPLASAICNRIGCRVTTIIGALIASVGCAISFFAYSMNYLLFSVGIVMGIGFGLMYCPAIVIVTMYFEKYRSLATGITVCGAGIGTFVFSQLASAICNRIGCRVTTIIGALIASVGCAISYFAYSMNYLLFSVGIVMGIGFGLMYCPAIVIVTMYFEKYRSLATGITVCGAGIGTFVFSQVISNLIIRFNWRYVFLIYSAVVLLCVPCGALYRPIEFVPIYEDEEEEELGENEIKAANDRGETDDQQPNDDELSTLAETATVRVGHGLVPPQQLRPARSHQLISKVSVNGIGIASAEEAHGADNGGGGLGQRFFSIGDHLHVAGKKSGGVSVSTGYLNFKDVFYSGSITELPEYKEQRFRFRSVSSLSHGSSTAVGGSAIRPASAAIGGQTSIAQQPVTVQKDRIEEEKDEEMELETAEDGGGTAGRERNGSSEERMVVQSTTSGRAIEIWRTVKRMLDLSLLTIPVYLLFGISNFFTSIGFNAPPMFMPLNAEIVLGWTKTEASLTVSAYGIANTLGRIVFGFICDRELPFSWGKDRARNRLWIYNLTLVLCGVISCLVFLLTSFYSFVAYCFLFGFTISSYVCLTSVVLVDMVGVDRLTNAYGLLLFIQGIATFFGPPLAGKLFDLTKRYDWTFGLCGGCLFISGVMLFVVPMFSKNQQQKENGKPKTTKSRQNAEQQELLIVRSDSPQHKTYAAV